MQNEVNGFVREIRFVPGWRKSGDRHFMEVAFYLKGPKATIQFMWGSGIYPYKEEEMWPPSDCLTKPMLLDLGYHAREEQYEGQGKMSSCEFVPGGCYYDGSSVGAAGMLGLLAEKGEEVIWERLEEEYRRRFEEGKEG